MTLFEASRAVLSPALLLEQYDLEESASNAQRWQLRVIDELSGWTKLAPMGTPFGRKSEHRCLLVSQPSEC